MANLLYACFVLLSVQSAFAIQVSASGAVSETSALDESRQAMNLSTGFSMIGCYGTLSRSALGWSLGGRVDWRNPATSTFSQALSWCSTRYISLECATNLGYEVWCADTPSSDSLSFSECTGSPTSSHLNGGSNGGCLGPYDWGTYSGVTIYGGGWHRGVLYDTQAVAPAAGGAAAVGDPHLQNVHGERFDLMKPGKHVLINIPRGVTAEKTLLRVQADARRLGGQCADMYFQELNVTGSWAEAKQAGGYHYTVSQRDVEAPEWVAFGKVGLKVAHGRTASGLSYLNLYVKNLGRAGYAVGGLLGEDDHEDVITPPAECGGKMSLIGLRAGDVL